MRLTEELHYSNLLAEFVNLTPDKAQAWREANPGFFPWAWWDYVATDFQGKPLGLQWEFMQGELRNTWDWRFDGIGPYFLNLQLGVFDPERMYFPNRIRPRFPSPCVLAMQGSDLDWYPYHRALLYLRDHSKLVKTCVWRDAGGVCCRPIVNRTYCETHAEEARCRSNHEYYESHAEELRAARNAKYTPKGNRRGPYKRKKVLTLPL
jgi:hypothetical protein